MFGVVPKALWSRMVEPDSANRIPLQANCVLLEPVDHSNEVDDLPKRILIETGYGNKWSEKERSIFALEDRTIVTALKEINIQPKSIDMVIVTHLHFDHAGGLTFWEGNEAIAHPTFPDATIVVQQTEWDDALANKSTMSKTYLRNHLDPIESQVQCVDGECEVVPGITVWPMPGHTWGQQAICFQSESGIVCFPGDCLPTVNHIGSAFSMGYDMLPFTNQQSKLELLSRAAHENWQLVLDHEPGHPVQRVRERQDRPNEFEFQPVDAS